MSKFLEKEFNVLKSKGIMPNDLTASEITMLVHITDKLSNPFDEVNADACGMPIKAYEGVYLWRPSIGAICWLDEYANKWWGDQNKMYFWTLVYALKHSREKDAFIELKDEHTARRVIINEALRTAAHEDELRFAVNKALNINLGLRKSPKREIDDTNWSAIISRLETQTGISSDVWCWQKSADYAVQCSQDLTRFALAFNGGKSLKHMMDEVDYVMRELALLRKCIIDRIAEKRKENDKDEQRK